MAVSSNTKPSKSDSPSHHLLLFSGTDTTSITQTAEKVSGYAEAHPDRIPDIAHTLASQSQTGTTHRAYAVVDRDNVSLPLQLSSIVENFRRKPAVDFVFTGQGAQWAGMGAELLSSYPSFRKDVKEMDRVLQQLPHPPLWTIEDELLRSPEKSRIQHPELSIPVCTALQIGLVNLLRSSFNLRPDAVVGHSTGEIAAAYASGSLSLATAITVAYYCGHATQHLGRQGAMAAVGLSPEDVQAYLSDVDGVVVACENSPLNVTLSGDKAALETVIANIKADKPDSVARLLRVERAFHSQHIRDIGQELEDLLRQGLGSGSEGQSKAPTIPFFSTVTAGKVEGKGKLGPAYWRENLEAPVRFEDAARLMLQSTASKDGVVLIEVGPHSALSKPLEEILDSTGEIKALTQYIATVVRGQGVVKSLLNSVGRLSQESAVADVSLSTTAGKILDDLLW